MSQPMPPGSRCAAVLLRIFSGYRLAIKIQPHQIRDTPLKPKMGDYIPIT